MKWFSVIGTGLLYLCTVAWAQNGQASAVRLSGPAGNLVLPHAVHAVLPSMIVIPVGEEVLMALVSLRPAAL
jgi:hypothetical protein